MRPFFYCPPLFFGDAGNAKIISTEGIRYGGQRYRRSDPRCKKILRTGGMRISHEKQPQTRMDTGTDVRYQKGVVFT